jgi:hypothetical protein
MDDELIDAIKTLDIKDGEIVGLKEKRPEIGMMVSLDHSIYFHNPKAFRADDWILAEAETPWAGEGRGFVMQRMFSKDGTLIASCVQEVWLFCYPLLRFYYLTNNHNRRVLFGSSKNLTRNYRIIVFHA